MVGASGWVWCIVESEPLALRRIGVVAPPGDQQVEMRPRRGMNRQQTAHTELVDLALALAAGVADLPALVAILAAESDARGDAFAARAGNMAADIVRLIIAEVGLDAA